MYDTLTTALPRPASRLSGALHLSIVGLTAFLTVVDLFATQAILPSLTAHYRVSPAAMAAAVNACTVGMAVAGLAVAWLSPRINRRWGIVASLTALAVPTALLASAPDLATFTVLRVLQGVCMATAFALTLAYLAEECAAADASGAFAAYITGNVASNLIGRLLAAAVVDGIGLAENFYVFAGLNLAGAGLVWLTLRQTRPLAPPVLTRSAHVAVFVQLLRNRALQTSFAIGFLILFVFIGTFTYVNFVLVRPPLAVSMMTLGFVYFVFLPSILTTPLAGRLVARLGTRRTFAAVLAVAAAGLPLLLAGTLSLVLAGMVLVAVGTFLAQATATGYVGRNAEFDRGAASGLYLASYFLGGMAGTAVLGQVFDRFGWAACVAAIGAATVLLFLLVLRLAPAPGEHSGDRS